MVAQVTANTKGAWRGHLAMLFANMVWGLMSPIAKGILQTGAISPVALSAIRILGGTLLFIVLGQILPHNVAPREKVARGDYFKLLLASVLMISANQGLYIIGIGFTTPVDSAVMSTTTPVFTLIFATIFIKMPLTWLKVLGVALGIGGALLMVAGGGTSSAVATNPALGDAMCLGAQMCAAIYYVMFRGVIQRYSPFTLMKWMFLFSTITYIPFTIPELVAADWAAVTPTTVLEIAYVVVFATFISYLLIPYSQRRLKPTVVAMYTYFQPVTSSLLAAAMSLAVFGEVKIAATALIFLGVFCVTRAK
jgi:drug/metabolite transporter (DMT)-like permease